MNEPRGAYDAAIRAVDALMAGRNEARAENERLRTLLRDRRETLADGVIVGDGLAVEAHPARRAERSEGIG